MTPGYSMRARIEPIAQLGPGVHRIQVDCWRFTANVINNNDNVFLFDGAPVGPNNLGDANKLRWPWRFAVGGVLLPDGMPVMLNQVVTLNIVQDSQAGGVLIYEYLDPHV